MPYLGDPQGREAQLAALAAAGGNRGVPRDRNEFIQMLLDDIEAGRNDFALAESRLTSYGQGPPDRGSFSLRSGGKAADDYFSRLALKTAQAERAGMHVNMEQAEPNEPLPSTLFDYGQSSAVTGKRTHPTNPNPPQSTWFGSQASSYRQPWEEDDAPRRPAARTTPTRSAPQAALTGLGSAFNSPLRRT